MKKNIFIGLLFLGSLGLFAQTSIPNGDLETWSTISFDISSGFGFSSNDEIAKGGGNTFNMTKSTESRTGTYALKLSTIDINGSASTAYAVNGEPSGDNPMSWLGSKDISEQPAGLSGYYKYNQATADSFIVIIAFSKNGVQTGFYFGSFGGSHSTYTAFRIPFTGLPASDSITIAFASSDIFNGTPVIGAELILDDLSFDGVTTQPTWLDGGFENWSIKNIDTAFKWYDDGGNSTFAKTTDKFSGSYAAELTTQLGTNRAGVPIARAGRLSNGYYPDNCGGGCNQLGGSPCTTQKDSLVFRYKYAPSGLDTAQAYINLKKDGVQFYGNNVFLHPTSTFKTAKIGWDAIQAPDSIMITFESSLWTDSAASFAGSKLIIDDIHLESDRSATSVFKTKQLQFSVSPNPASKNIDLNLSSTSAITIFNLSGAVVKKSIIESKELISVENLDNGNYIILVQSEGLAGTKKLIVKH